MLPSSSIRFLTFRRRPGFFLPNAEGAPLKSAAITSPVLFLVGPEGGWTDDEIDRARAAAFRAVSLGSGILRSETAAIVGAALIRQELGDMWRVSAMEVDA